MTNPVRSYAEDVLRLSVADPRYDEAYTQWSDRWGRWVGRRWVTPDVHDAALAYASRHNVSIHSSHWEEAHWEVREAKQAREAAREERAEES